MIIFYSLDYNFLFSFIIGISFFIGDVYFSYIKRLLDLKDFSNLLRSHGGILDRLDSIFLIVIFFNTYLYFHEKKILIIGSTGKLGKLLLNYSKNNNIQIDAVASYKNYNLQVKQQSELNIKYGFCLSKNGEMIKFNKFIKSHKFKIVYF